MIDLSTVAARFALARKYALKYTLDPVLVAAVCERESSWNPWAVRFEHGFLLEWVKPLKPAEPTTRELTSAMSFGLMQVMGLTAIELGFSGKFLTTLCDPDWGVEFGCKKLAKCFDIHRERDAALLAYNGGGDPNYPNLVTALMPHYQEMQ